MKKLFLATAAAVLCLPAPALARPQLHTQSIGWINPTDIRCEQTSDHTCVVTDDLAFTREGQHSHKQKYRVMAGTMLVIINKGQNNEAADRGENENVYIYNKPVEVAIVIPADWDDRPEHKGYLRPDKPCRLMTHGKFPPIVSLSCR
jgi:hypothetical protein